MNHRIRNVLIFVLILVVSIGVLFLIEVAAAISSGKASAFANPSHAPVYLGTSGPPLNYVVIGDSTGAGRGANYADGLAMTTARFLSRNHRVTMTNFSRSGAVIADVADGQVRNAAALRPDLVLLAVGANDATHFTPGAKIRSTLCQIIDSLRQSSPHVKIVVTGCPQMGSVPRFQQPLRWFAGIQTWRVNEVFANVVAAKHVGWAHIADRTGIAFSNNPHLFASDNFHPNARGYALWCAVINPVLANAIK